MGCLPAAQVKHQTDCRWSDGGAEKSEKRIGSERRPARTFPGNLNDTGGQSAGIEHDEDVVEAGDHCKQGK